MLSRLFDHDKKEWVWVEGNFIIDLRRPLYILAESLDEFIKARDLLLEATNMDRMSIHFLQSAEMLTRTGPAIQIFLYGAWWECEDVVHSPAFTKLLNEKI